MYHRWYAGAYSNLDIPANKLELIELVGELHSEGSFMNVAGVLTKGFSLKSMLSGGSWVTCFTTLCPMKLMKSLNFCECITFKSSTSFLSNPEASCSFLSLDLRSLVIFVEFFFSSLSLLMATS